MSRSSVRILIPEVPLHIEAVAADAGYVGLGQADGSPHYRVFVQLAPPDAAACGVMVHISLADAQFLRDAIGTVLDQHRLLTENAN